MLSAVLLQPGKASACYYALLCKNWMPQAMPSLYGCRRLQALDAYSDQMRRRDEEIDVLECALLIAKHAHPDLVMVATLF